jgi:hypothetical protein
MPGTAAGPAVEIRIEASALPGRSCGPGPDAPGGHDHIHVAVQRRARPAELLGLVPGDAPSATWTLEATAPLTPAGRDLKGPYIQGPPGARFIYLNGGQVDQPGNFVMFRRAKLMFDAVGPDLREAAPRSGLLVGRLGLTDNQGNPLCAAVRPPVIAWSAAR